VSYYKEKFYLKHQAATALSIFKASEPSPQHRCLMYHSVYQAPSGPRDVYSLPIEKLARQMEYLQERGWPIIPFGAPGLPDRKSVSVTFDDGFADNLLLAYPLLKQMKIPFTIFMISDFTKEKPGYLNPNQLRELARDPLVTIGAHGKTHQPLANLPFAEAKEELRISKMELQDILGREVTTMSFPHGSFNQALIDAAQELGYQKCGTSVALGNPAVNQQARVDRQCIFLSETSVSFAQKLRGQWDWLAR
jgi:peptidoglycan/xylan/chitin deacetylase (PgdA/CDA1 family)